MTQTAQAPKLSDAQEIRTASPMRQAGPMRSIYLLAGTVLPALVTAALLLTPLVVITAHRFSLIGMTEESTGYRYFYSLRYLYTDNERPWVPQGQAMTIIHMAVQLLLTAIGYSPIELRPRMDLFVVSTVALPHIATALALVWAVLPLRSLFARLAVVGTLLLVSLGGTGAWDRHLLLPDYYSWIHTLAMVALGCCLRFANPEWQPTRRWTVGLGVFAGVCLGLKVTLLLLAVVPVLLWLQRQPLTTPRVVLRELLVMGGVAVATFGVILIVAHAFSPSAVLQFFLVMLSFDALEGHREGTSLPARMADALMNHPSMLVRVEHVALLVQVAGLALLRNRMVSAATVVGAFLSLVLLAVRDTPTTLVEIGDGVMISTIVWVVAVGAPQLGAAVRGQLPFSASSWIARWGALGAQALLCVGLFAVVIPSLNHMTTQYLDLARLANANERQLNAFTNNPPGKVAIVTLSNEYHPYTSDSAIFKGGTNISQRSVWGVSGLVRDIVSNRWYFYPDVALAPPIDLAPYQYLLFVSREPRDRLSVTQSLMEKAFGISTIGFDCPIQLPNPEDNGLQYACKRTPDAPLSEHAGEIAFVPSAVQVLPNVLAYRRDGSRRPLEVGEAVYSGNTREIWRLNEDWTFTRLRGQPGETRTIPSVGAWSTETRALTGLSAIFDGTHWQLPPAQHFLNSNTPAQRENAYTLPGWDILAPQATTVRMIPDLRNSFDSAWLELRVRSTAERIGMRTVIHLDESLTGSPIDARLTIRQIGAGELRIQLMSWDGSTAGPPADQTRVVGTDGRHTYHLRLEPEQIIGPDVELLIELTDPAVGDGIDIQDATIMDGRYP